MTPQPHPPIDGSQTPYEASSSKERVTDPLNDLEQSLLAIEGLFEAIYELSETDDVRNRRLLAIYTVCGYLIKETRQAREAFDRVFEVMRQRRNL